MRQSNAAVLKTLRSQVEHHAGYKQRDQRFAPELDFTIPAGSLVGMSGTGKTEWVARFLASNPKLKAAWIEEQLTIYPAALMQRNIDLKRVLFSEAGKNLLWTTQQVLGSQLFQAVIVTDLITHDRALRRLQMAAEKSNATVFLLSDHPCPSWSLALKLQVNKRGFNAPLDVQVTKRRI